MQELILPSIKRALVGHRTVLQEPPLDYVALPSELLLNFSALQDWVIALSELLTLAGSNGHLC